MGSVWFRGDHKTGTSLTGSALVGTPHLTDLQPGITTTVEAAWRCSRCDITSCFVFLEPGAGEFVFEGITTPTKTFKMGKMGLKIVHDVL